MLTLKGRNALGVDFILEVRDNEKIAKAIASLAIEKEPERRFTPKSNYYRGKRIRWPADCMSVGQLLKAFAKGHIFEWKLRETMHLRGYNQQTIEQEIGRVRMMRSEAA